MPDPYLPTLADFQYAANELAAIEAASETESPWDWQPGGKAEDAFKSAKKRIWDFQLKRHNDTCCYCRTNLHGAGPFMTDREHVLPKSKTAYKAYIFAIWNLAAACKRCNMQLKKASDAFVIDKVAEVALKTAENYLLVHPNFDRWEEHLHRVSAQVDANILVFYGLSQGSKKAVYTHDFFKLRDLEINSFDAAQGLVAEDTPTMLAMAIRDLAKEFGQ